MGNFIYKGEKTKEISFPLGGIGTGCQVCRQRFLIDWEIFNKPTRGASLVSAICRQSESAGKVLMHGC